MSNESGAAHVMPIGSNTFKRAIYSGKAQIGLWLALADPYAAEIVATTGFDWLLIDGEHAPNDIRSILGQLQAIAPYPSHAIVRPVTGDVAMIKQLLDIGAQTLLVPMVETAEQARQLVAATRYARDGIRGVGASIARASRWNQVPEYFQRAATDICLLVQVESQRGLDNLNEITAVEGVDGVFFGPNDLAASMGFGSHAGHATVQSAIFEGIAAVRRSGKAAGILTADRSMANKCLDAGALFVAVGCDTSRLVQAACELARQFGRSGPFARPSPGGAY